MAKEAAATKAAKKSARPQAGNKRRGAQRPGSDDDLALLRRCVAKGRLVVGEGDRAAAERLASRGLVSIHSDNPAMAPAIIATTDGRQLARNGKQPA